MIPLPDFLKRLNTWVRMHHKGLELLGVLMRIASFATVSWMGEKSPFLVVWIVNTTDAIILSWCSLVRRDAAYVLLNVFWILVGVVGILRASGVL